MPFPDGLDMEGQPWRRYVERLCLDAWQLEDEATREVLVKIEALVAGRVLTDPAVELVLRRAGVAPVEAAHIAPSIRVAITA